MFNSLYSALMSYRKCVSVLLVYLNSNDFPQIMFFVAGGSIELRTKPYHLSNSSPILYFNELITV